MEGATATALCRSRIRDCTRAIFNLTSPHHHLLSLPRRPTPSDLIQTTPCRISTTQRTICTFFQAHPPLACPHARPNVSRHGRSLSRCSSLLSSISVSNCFLSCSLGQRSCFLGSLRGYRSALWLHCPAVLPLSLSLPEPAVDVSADSSSFLERPWQYLAQKSWQDVIELGETRSGMLAGSLTVALECLGIITRLTKYDALQKCHWEFLGNEGGSEISVGCQRMYRYTQAI